MKKLRLLLSRLGRWDSWRRLPLKFTAGYLAPERPRRFPTKVQIEATSTCNLRCPCCCHSREKDIGGHLAEEDFSEVLDRLPKRPKRVILSGIGEPLMSPHFFSLVDALAARRIACEFYTNGTLLKPRVREAILARGNIDAISISCDGARAQTFESLRVGADFERWKQSVRRFLTEKRETRRQPLSVGANVVLAKQNLGELGDIIRLAADLGFDSVYVMQPIPVDDVAASFCPSAAELSTVQEEDLFALAQRLSLRISCFFGRAAGPPKAMLRCTQPWEYVFVRVNGDVAPCCAVFGAEKGAVMGNILQQEFGEIWRGAPFRQFRRTSASGTNPLCRVCPYY